MRKRLMSTNVGTPQPRRVRAGAADETPLQQAKRKTKPAADDAESGKPVSHLYQDVHGNHIPQQGRQGPAGPLRVCELIALVRYLHAVDAVHSSDKCTDADRLLIVLDGLPRLLYALSGVHEDIWSGATIEEAIEAASDYLRARFADVDLAGELAAADDALHALLEQVRQWSEGAFV
ncbi:MAG: hypothetical protein IK051_10710 [Rhodocyclaceae bacterium]|nr:hypothetical protein [Rhodocyclaceae bacterium]